MINFESSSLMYVYNTISGLAETLIFNHFTASFITIVRCPARTLHWPFLRIIRLIIFTHFTFSSFVLHVQTIMRSKKRDINIFPSRIACKFYELSFFPLLWAFGPI
jgi:hypothetical protein